MDASHRSRGIAKWSFWIAVIASGVTGIKIVRLVSYQILMAAPILSEHWVLSLVALKMLAAVLTFVVLMLAFNVVVANATMNGIKMDTRRIIRGAIYSALLPLIQLIVFFLLILLFAGGMHDSM